MYSITLNYFILNYSLRGGENIYPAEIEAILVKHPNIVDAHVIGVESKRLGEEVLFFIDNIILYNSNLGGSLHPTRRRLGTK